MNSIRVVSVLTLTVALAPLSGCEQFVAPHVPPEVPTSFPDWNKPAPAFPPLAKPGEIYKRSPSYHSPNHFHQGEVASRFVLYPDSTFALQSSSAGQGFHQWYGHYSREGSRITLIWDATQGVWQATASLEGGRLRVDFNEWMELTDFGDGEYLYVPGGS